MWWGDRRKGALRRAWLPVAVLVAGGVVALSGGTAGASGAAGAAGASGASVAAGATGATAATFASSAVGLTGSTPLFTMSGPWAMKWSYDCAGFGGPGTFSVTVNEPTGDPELDLGPSSEGTGAAGTDYYYDTGTFNLSVISECTWTVTVLPSSAGAAAVPATFASSAMGTTGSSQELTVSGAWTLAWSYNCAVYGSAGNFSVTIQQLTGSSDTDVGPTTLGTSGSGTDDYTEGGTFDLEVVSECTWSITAGGTATAPPSAAFGTFTRIYGNTADATAAAEVEHQFPPGIGCPGTTGTRPIVLATDGDYPDALASAYLTKHLGTGTLLTSGTSLSAAAATAIRAEGITMVDVVGGPEAVTTAVVSTLESTPISSCGGTSQLSGHLQVNRIWGTTEYDTAAKVAESVPASAVGRIDVTGAYAAGPDGNAGLYNDTTGSASAAPASSSPLPTAIVATGDGFQDAEAASTLAYADELPILLTTPSTLSTQVTSAIGALGIQQVVVMGGPEAVSTAVVASLEGMKIAVLRIAGQSDTDTAVQLARFETASSTGHAGMGWAGTGSVVVARGDLFADGLAGAVVAADGPTGATPEPLLLTEDPSTPGTSLTSFLESAGFSGIGGRKVISLTVLGGPDAVTPTAIDVMGNALRT